MSAKAKIILPNGEYILVTANSRQTINFVIQRVNGQNDWSWRGVY